MEKIVWSESTLAKAFPLMDYLAEDFRIMTETITSIDTLHEILKLSVNETTGEVLLDHLSMDGVGL